MELPYEYFVRIQQKIKVRDNNFEENLTIEPPTPSPPWIELAMVDCMARSKQPVH